MKEEGREGGRGIEKGEEIFNLAFNQEYINICLRSISY